MASPKKRSSDAAARQRGLARREDPGGILRRLPSEVRPEDVLKSVVDTAARAVGADASLLVPVGTEKNFFFQKGFPRKGGPRGAYPGSMLLDRALRGKKPLLIADLKKSRRYVVEAAELVEEGFRSALVLPLTWAGKSLGSMALFNKQGSPSFTRNDSSLVGGLAGYAGVLIDNVITADALREKDRELKMIWQEVQGRLSRRLAILYEVGQAMTATLELDDLLDLIVKLAARHLKSEKASLMLIEESTGEMRINSSIGLKKWIVRKTRIRVGHGIAGTVAATGKPMLIEDIAASKRILRPSRNTYQTGSFISVPLRRQEKILGVLSVSDKRSYGPFSQDDLNLITTLAAQAAIAVENATLYNDLREKMSSLQSLYQIREAERRQLSTLIHSINDAILAVDLERRLLFINDKAKSLLKISESLAERKPLKDHLQSEELSQLILKGMESALTPVSIRQEISLTMGGSRRKHYEITSLPIKDRKADLIGALTIIRDITEFKELDRVRSDFLSRASHQLKTPVGLIQGFADTLFRHPDLDDQRRNHFLKLINSESDRLGHLIENLLDFAQLESKTLRVEKEEVEIKEILAKLLPAFEQRAAEKDIEVICETGKSFPLLVTDRKCIMEVLQNVLENCLRFTPREGRIRISAQRQGGSLEITVSDTGEGIRDEDLPHIFDKFYTGRSSSPSGTGLGLYLAKEIVNSLGGSIRLTSRIGRGTTVVIVLPLAENGIK